MSFFYSKGLVIFQLVALLTLTGTFLIINTAFIWAPVKHPSGYLAEIVLGIIFLPGTFVFGVKARYTLIICNVINKPAITLSKAGYQHGNRRFSWNSIDNIVEIYRYGQPFIVVKLKNIAGNIEKDVIDLSLFREKYLFEYMEEYMLLSYKSGGKQFKRG